jgi:pSer/pThr/pTyr-binding forkhead associated (FHA) protein
MSNSLSKDFGLINGQTYIIGRRGHICIDSPAVSKHHAAIIIKNGRIYLRDLNSTNGTYLVNNDNLVDFKEGYVTPNQPIVIGNVKCTVYSLLASIGDNPTLKIHSSNLEDSTQLVIPTIPHYETSDPDIRPLQR